MKCHILFSEKNKKNISKCRLLKILPRVLSVKKSKHMVFFLVKIYIFLISPLKHTLLLLIGNTCTCTIFWVEIMHL